VIKIKKYFDFAKLYIYVAKNPDIVYGRKEDSDFSVVGIPP
jgi:hypothetical protein